MSTQRTDRPSVAHLSRRLWLAPLGIAGGLGLLNGQVGLAQVEAQVEVGALETEALEVEPFESAPPVTFQVEEIEEVPPIVSPLPAALEPAPSDLPLNTPSLPPTPAPSQTPIEPSAERVEEPSEVVRPTRIVPAEIPSLPGDYNSVFIDPTDYSIGATSPEATSEVPEIVVTERSSGCQFSINDARAFPDSACAQTSVGQASSQSSPIAQSDPSFRPAQQVSQQANTAPSPGQSVNIGPVSFSASGIRIANGNAVENRAYFNRAVRPIVNSQVGQKFIFPLSIPSPITSLFGWRQHPIFGDQRFHAGTDIGAPEGTPVLAAQAGRVVTSGDMGGYGLTVALRHGENEDLESLYPHLSEILVEAGEQVKKGDVIGLVGSTGNSTGPHLHFEMRQLTADGWVIVNSDAVVRQSLAAMVQALNNPVQVLSQNIAAPKFTSTAEATSQIAQDSPFRPAQPNAH